MSNGLDVALMNDPFGEWSPESGDRHLEIAFNNWEWGSFYFRALGVLETPYVEGEDFLSYETRRQKDFRESLKEYPLLARIDDFYNDANFAKDEVRLLRVELERVEGVAMDSLAHSFWKGMLDACGEAQSAGMGIRLLSS